MPPRIASPTGRARTLPAIHPHAGLTSDFERKLSRLIEQMHSSLRFFVLRAYAGKPPELAQDAPDGSVGMSPARYLMQRMRELGRRWLIRFDDAAPDLAKYFARKARERTDAALKAALSKAGISVRFTTTRTVNDIVQATVAQTVGLIRSIAAEHLQEVEGLVMRSVQTGRDIGALTKDLRERYGITQRRAALIARTQNSAATSAVNRARQIEIGVTECVWVHSTAGSHPRPSHVKAGWDRLTYDPREGALIDGERIWPGQLINCRCVCRPVLPGFA